MAAQDDDRGRHSASDLAPVREEFGCSKAGFLPDKDVIRVGRREGRFNQIQLRVFRNKVHIINLRVVYANGAPDDIPGSPRFEMVRRVRSARCKAGLFFMSASNTGYKRQHQLASGRIMSPQIIAQRIYVIAGSPEIEVRVDVHRPIPDGNDYRCDYAIAWPENPTRGYAMGVDSLQALYLGLQKIAIDLDASEPARSGQLSWLGDPGNFGLPSLPPMR